MTSAAVGTEFLDANPVLRYLLADHPEHFTRAQALIESDRQFRISLVTLLVVAYVLTRVAEVSRADTVDALIDFVERENITIHELGTDAVVEALRLCRDSGRVSFADAALWALARAAAPATIWTFDERFPASGTAVAPP